jgi:thymidylate synthase (FAD)
MKAELVDYMGTDLTVVNAARCSFSTVSNELTKGDIGLINFLARGCMSKDWTTILDDIHNLSTNVHDCREEIEDILKYVKNMPTHWSPFAHAMITMRETVPIFVARQRFKHVVGFSYNEVSRRYVDDTPEFHMPEVWRARPVGGIKQGSGKTNVKKNKYGGQISQTYNALMTRCEEFYTTLIDSGVAPEQARMVLPQSMLTTYWVTGSLYAWANAFIQRSDPHAQVEIQQLAAQWETIIQPLFPESWEALTK